MDPDQAMEEAGDMPLYDWGTIEYKYEGPKVVSEITFDSMGDAEACAEKIRHILVGRPHITASDPGGYSLQILGDGTKLAHHLFNSKTALTPMIQETIRSTLWVMEHLEKTGYQCVPQVDTIFIINNISKTPNFDIRFSKIRKRDKSETDLSLLLRLIEYFGHHSNSNGIWTAEYSNLASQLRNFHQKEGSLKGFLREDKLKLTFFWSSDQRRDFINPFHIKISSIRSIIWGNNDQNPFGTNWWTKLRKYSDLAKYKEELDKHKPSSKSHAASVDQEVRDCVNFLRNAYFHFARTIKDTKHKTRIKNIYDLQRLFELVFPGHIQMLAEKAITLNLELPAHF